MKPTTDELIKKTKMKGVYVEVPISIKDRILERLQGRLDVLEMFRNRAGQSWELFIEEEIAKIKEVLG